MVDAADDTFGLTKGPEVGPALPGPVVGSAVSPPAAEVAASEVDASVVVGRDVADAAAASTPQSRASASSILPITSTPFSNVAPAAPVSMTRSAPTIMNNGALGWCISRGRPGRKGQSSRSPSAASVGGGGDGGG